MTSPRSDPTPTDAEVSRYVAEVCDALRRLAQHRPRLRALAYLLDMARLEGEQRAKGRGRSTR